MMSITMAVKSIWTLATLFTLIAVSVTARPHAGMDPPMNADSQIGKRAPARFQWLKETKGQLKGVNIGGWLVLEPWITPSLFTATDVVDEYTLCAKNPQAHIILNRHWGEWATQAHFQQLHEAGFNMVRIPVGYWAFKMLPGDPYKTGAADWLDKAIGWAGGLGMYVMVDLHGAPGSQNGFDNSGQKTTTPSFTSQANIDLTLEVLGMLNTKYATNPTVAGIAILNEPFPQKMGDKQQQLQKVEQFHKAGVAKVSGTAAIVSDAFEQPSYWDDKFSASGQQGNQPGGPTTAKTNSSSAVIIDHHDYQVFDDDLLRKSTAEHTTHATSLSFPSTHPIIIGEFSGAMTDCAKYLNGRTEGARWESKYSLSKGLNKICPPAVNDLELFRNDKTLVEETRKFVNAQVKSFGETSGWFFWNFRTEGAGEWDALFLNGLGGFFKGT